ncbi:hypothetical protein ABPG72_002497 [Tetrahymena utriculariae]
MSTQPNKSMPSYQLNNKKPYNKHTSNSNHISAKHNHESGNGIEELSAKDIIRHKSNPQVQEEIEEQKNNSSSNIPEGSVSIHERGYFFMNEIVDCNDDSRLAIPFTIWPISKGDKSEYELHKTICAFLNLEGGVIILGINKKTKSVQGIRVTDAQRENFALCVKNICSQFYPQVDEDEIGIDYFPIRSYENKQIIIQEMYVLKVRVNQGKLRDRLYKWPYSIDPVGSVVSQHSNSRFVAENKSIVSYKRDGELNKRIYYIEQEEEIISRARNPVPLAQPIVYPPPTFQLILSPYILQIFDIPISENRKKIMQIIFSKFNLQAEEHGQHVFLESKIVPINLIKGILEFAKEKEAKMYSDLGAKKVVVDGKARLPPHNSANLVVVNNSLSSRRDEYQKKLEQLMSDRKIQHTCPQFQHRIVYSVADLEDFKSNMLAEKNTLKSYCFENKFEIVTPQKQLDLYNINPAQGEILKEEIDQLFEGLNIERCDKIDQKGYKLQYYFSDPYEMLIANDRIKNTSSIKSHFKEQQIKIFMPYNEFIQ